MLKRLTLSSSIVVASISLSGCLTWPENTSPTNNGPFSSAPPSQRGKNPLPAEDNRPDDTLQDPAPAPTTPTDEADGPLNSPVVIYRPKPKFEPVVVDTSTQPPLADTPQDIVVQRGSGGQGNAAVRSLVVKADEAYDRGDYDGAIVQLERAVRIEPRNGHVWYKIASLRMALQEPEKAESLAQKSLSFAGNDKQLQADNWELIAVTRRMRGDTAGANLASRQAGLATQER